MNSELFTALAEKCQHGDRKAMEQLLMNAYVPVSYLARKILQDEAAAQQITREVLEVVHRKLDSLADPARILTWMCRITAARCMHASAMFHQEEEADSQVWQEELAGGVTLTEEQSARIIQQMVDSLPGNERLCILLLGCGGLTVPAIAQLSGFSDTTVKQCIRQGQETIQEYLWELDARGIQFTGLSSLTGILRTAMLSGAPGEEAIQAVYPIIGRKIRAPFSFSRLVVRFLTAVLLLELAAIGIVGGYIALQMYR